MAGLIFKAPYYKPGKMRITVKAEEHTQNILLLAMALNYFKLEAEWLIILTREKGLTVCFPTRES